MRDETLGSVIAKLLERGLDSGFQAALYLLTLDPSGSMLHYRYDYGHSGLDAVELTGTHGKRHARFAA